MMGVKVKIRRRWALSKTVGREPRCAQPVGANSHERLDNSLIWWLRYIYLERKKKKII